MNRKEFNRTTARTLADVYNRLGFKGSEYADNEEVFRNFKNAGRMRGETPLKALDGMLTKHLVSYHDMIDGRLELTQGLIDEKIGDILTYMILAKALMEEEIEKKINMM